MYRQMEGHTDKHLDRRTADRQTDRQDSIPMTRQIYTNRHIDRPTGKWTDWYTRVIQI